MLEQNVIAHKVLEAIMDNITFGTAQPEGYAIREVSEYFSDEHDIHRTVVVEELVNKRFYKFAFRFNYFMKDSEIMDHVPFVEVEPFEQVVISYKTKD